MLNRNELRSVVGREFTVRDVAEGFGLSDQAARWRVHRLTEAGIVEPSGEVLQYVGDDGRPLRGRPATVYRVS